MKHRRIHDTLFFGQDRTSWSAPYPDAENHERKLRGYDRAASPGSDVVLTLGQACAVASIVNAYRFLLGSETSTTMAIKKLRAIKAACRAEAAKEADQPAERAERDGEGAK